MESSFSTPLNVKPKHCCVVQKLVLHILVVEKISTLLKMGFDGMINVVS